MNAGRTRTALLTAGLVATTAIRVTLAQSEQVALRQRMLEAEDTRAATPDALAPLLEGLKSGQAATQIQALRALGRLERPTLVDEMAPLLSASRPEVRAEAAGALAQAVYRGGAEPARQALLARLAAEPDPEVRSSILAALGRLPCETEADVRRAERAIRDAISPETAGGAAQGLEALARVHAKRTPLEPATVERLRELSESRLPEPLGTRVRRLAVMALVAARIVDPGAVRKAGSDSDDQVRRWAVQLWALAPPPRPALEAALRDPSPIVRHEALRSLGRVDPPAACGPALATINDPNPHVALLAIDLVGAACGGNDGAVSVLYGVIGPAVRGSERTWHRSAHALVSLARVRPDRAVPEITRFSTDGVWQMRMYAARAAAIAKRTPVIQRLASDPDDNVREAALTGLRELEGHQADDAFVAALSRDDCQLLITAAAALAGSPRRSEAGEALWNALDRLTAERRETSRDARRALIARLAELANPSSADRLRSYLGDFDPLVSEDAARLLSTWTGETYAARPRPLPRQSLPTPADLDRLARSRYLIRFVNGRVVTLRLFAAEAPLNSFRFHRLAGSGFFNGLTFHRIIPGFLVQGGSPGANEFAGDGPFTRDEVGISNLRGTLGVSTRGRDTGDGQIYINLIDNVRLDGEYTVFGQVVEGMDAVDDLVEGDVIHRIDITE